MLLIMVLLSKKERAKACLLLCALSLQLSLTRYIPAA